MKFYQDAGFLILGSRLRRFGEYYLSEINKVYQEKHIPFEASWFPLFYLLSQKDAVTLTDIASELSVSHSAISQLIKNLKEKKLITTTPLKEDKRNSLVKFTKKGKNLLEQILPVWKSIKTTLNKISKEKDAEHLLNALTFFENHFDATPLSGMILKNIK